jgi:hypothetical protein
MRVAATIEKLRDWLVENAAAEQADAWLVAVRALEPHRDLWCTLLGAKCRSCQVANALLQVLTLQREERAFEGELELARALDDGVDTINSITSLRRQVDAALDRANERRAHLVDPGDNLRDDLRAMKQALDAFERVRHGVRDGLRGQVTSEQLREPAQKKPRKIVLQDIEGMLAFVGFSDDEICGLIDDGGEGSRAQKVDRVRKRRAASITRERESGRATTLALVVRGHSSFGAAPPRVVLRW